MLKLWIYFTFICISKAAFGEKFSDVSNEYFDYYSGNVADNSYEDNEKSPYTSSDEFFLNSLKTTHWIDEALTTPELKNELINFDTNENNDFKTELDSKEREDSIKTESGDEDFSANESNNFGINIGKKLRVLDYQIEDNRSDENNNKNEYDSQGFSDRKDSLNLSDINDADMKTLSDEIEKEMNGEFSENNSGEKSNNKEMIKQILDDTKSVLSEDTGNEFAEDVLIKDQANKNITTAYKTIIDETKMILEETQGDLDEQSSIEIVEVTNKSTSNNEDNKYRDDEFIADLVELNNIKNELSDFDVDSNNSQNQNNDYFNSQENDDNDYENIIDTNLEQIFIDQDAAKNEDVIIHKVEPLSEYPLSFEADDIDTNHLETEKSSTGTSKDSLETSTSSTEFDSEEVARASENYIDTKNMTESQIDKLLIDFTGKNLENIVSSAKSSNNPERVWLSVDEPTVITSPGYPNPYPTNSITDWIFEGTGTGIEFNVTDCDINGHVGDYLLVKPGDVDDSGSNGLIFTYNLNTERRYRFIDVDRMFMRFQANMGMPFMRGFRISARMLVHAPIIREPEPESEPSIQYPGHTLTLNLGGISLEGFIEVEEQFRQIIADMATMYINANNISTEVNNTLEVTQITSKALCFHNWPGYEMCAEVQFGVPLFFEEGKRPRLDEEDLHDMWLQYFNQDPFAVRLRMLGITEFQVPNDNGVIVVWLVIAAGVVISMMMLAFALWRYSCFEDYSRMPMHSDTDSLADKRKLDMFPTPHQTLPPLYTDADYKWVDNDEHCKVDIGGYSNRNFLADDMFDVDSEDEIVPGRNRYTTDV